ncbi:phosphotransferase enzyme family protein [Streptomyces decoyicus]|uniref:phosphotransferase enzyme family protein n=1 Tax=Streptomyces decoyicus TaxID=249567 RepID=UPI00362B9745
MSPDWNQRLLSLLAPWNLSTPRLAAELTDLGDRSRVWRVESNNGPYVAKLTFDDPAFVEPGLRIAALLDRAGIPTGAPIPTVDGKLCRPVDRLKDYPWTLALHTFIPGAPLDLTSDTAPEQAGDLLGRVHHALMTLPDVPQPAGRMLDYYKGEAKRLGRRRGAALRKALTAIADFRTRAPLSEGVLYGDPAPEILQDPDSTALALIDWGSPSWGPLLHDVVSWQLFLTARQPPDAASTVERRFLTAYRARRPISEGEMDGRDLLLDLHRAIQDAWTPEPPTDAVG